MADRSRLAALAALLLAATPSLADRGVFGDIEIDVPRDQQGAPAHGYSEWRIVVTNNSKDAPRSVRLECPANLNTGYDSKGIRSLSRTVKVDAGQTAVVSILQPSRPQVAGYNLTVSVDGDKKDNPLVLRPVTGTGGGSGFIHGRRIHFGGRVSPVSEQMILSSQRVTEKFFEVGNAAVVPRPGPIGGPAMPPPPPVVFGGGAGRVLPMTAFDGQFLRADTPISMWSPRWLALTRYDLVVVTVADIEELERAGPDEKAVLAALWQYVEAGGALLVLGPGAVPVPATWAGTETKSEGLTVYRCGFGVCLVSPDAARDKWKSDRWSLIAREASSVGTPWKLNASVQKLNETFQVVEDVGVPVRGLFALMILFGIVIGPVNLVVLSRKNRRIWMLWTVPALSAVFCFAVLGYMVIAEGWRGHSRVAGFTILDEGERRATTIGKAAYYSPMTPSDGLRFSDDTEVLIQGGEHPAQASSCALDWTDGQHLSRGWVTARVPCHFTIRKSELRRERITVRKESGGLIAVNALGVGVTSLTLMDAEGDLWKCGPIAAGGSATLTRDSKHGKKPRPLEAWRKAYTATDWATAIGSAIKQPVELLGAGTYLAVVEESPFLEQGLRGAKPRAAESVVLGIMAADK